MSVVYRPGFFCDVCVLPNGSFAHVYESGLSVVCESALLPLWRTAVPEPLMFCRCAVAAHDGFLYSIHQGHDTGRALLVSGSGVKDLGLTFGVQPVAIDATYAYVVRSNQSYDRIRLDNGEVEHLPHGVPGSSQGISDVAPDGTIWWADLWRTLRFGGLTLAYPNTRGAVVVGQADPPQIAGLHLSQQRFTAIEGEAYEPHLAVSGDRYAICARTPKGAAFVVVPPFQALVAGAPVPVPVPQPKPEAPKPVSIPNQLPLVASIRGKYPTPLGPQHPFFLIEAAQATGAKLLRKDGGTHVTLPTGVSVSQDILMFGDQGIDILSDGEGAAIPSWQEKGTIPGEYIDVGFLPQPVPNPGTPAPTPGTDLAPLLAEIATLWKALDAEREERILVSGALQTFANSAHQRLDALDSRKYRATGSTSRDFGHSHRINVTLEPIQ